MRFAIDPPTPSPTRPADCYDVVDADDRSEAIASSLTHAEATRMVAALNDLIGDWSETRPTCGEVHVPAAYNPWLDLTWCLCGDHQWHGCTPATLHHRHVYDHAGQGARLLGYDIYWLEHSWPTT